MGIGSSIRQYIKKIKIKRNLAFRQALVHLENICQIYINMYKLLSQFIDQYMENDKTWNLMVFENKNWQHYDKNSDDTQNSFIESYVCAYVIILFDI